MNDPVRTIKKSISIPLLVFILQKIEFIVENTYYKIKLFNNI